MSRAKPMFSLFL